MDFTLTPEQTDLVTALEGLAAPFQHKPIEFRGYALVNEALEHALEEAGFFEIATAPGLGPVGAALAVERLARLPYAAETALSMLVGPHLQSGQLTRPLAWLERGKPGRFVANAKTLLIAEGDTLSVAPTTPDAVEPVDSIYAYPMGRLNRPVDAQPLGAGAAAQARKWLQIALAAEAAGLMQAAIDTTVEHLTLRNQFGRPLGSFQALRHRMAECAVLAGGVKHLALKAAGTAADSDAALAAFHAQETSHRICYDLHQMLGAMGITLEHPLHLWSYRLKRLTSELGGQTAQAQAILQHCF